MGGRERKRYFFRCREGGKSTRHEGIDSSYVFVDNPFFRKYPKKQNGVVGAFLQTILFGCVVVSNSNNLPIIDR